MSIRPRTEPCSRPANSRPPARVTTTIVVAAASAVASLCVSVSSAAAADTDSPTSQTGRTSAAATPRSAGPTNDPVQPRRPAAKPRGKTAIAAGQSRTKVHVKLVEGSRIRLRSGALVDATRTRRDDVAAVLRSYGARIERLFGTPEADLDAGAAAARTRSRREQADLNLYYRLAVPAGTDTAAFIEALNALDVVEVAYAEPEAGAIPVSPDFTPRQGYGSPAGTNGIDATYAWTVAGGTGANVRVHDLEYSWNSGHEDLSKLRVAFYANGTSVDPWNDKNHGTAVVGQISGDRNTYGVTGLVPDATLQVTNTNNTAGYDLANAIAVATTKLRAGDVMLLEQQAAGPNGPCGSQQIGCVAVEYYQAYYDAIVRATSLGIIVVEAAGNSNQNYDTAAFATTIGGRANSGAIMVGAGGSGLAGCTAARTRLGFSNYGSRVDLQGWGECVTTTGYGALQGGTNPNYWYTAGFSGTSSASPIVASAAAALSSVAKARGMTLTPAQVRSILRSTGTPQVFGTAGNIGPLPNLRAAIAALSGGGSTDTTPPSLTAPTQYVANGSVVGTTVPVTFAWSASDPSGISAYDVYLQTDGGTWVRQSLTTATATSMTRSLAPGHTYAVAVAARDGAGNWSGWSYGTGAGLGAWEENSGYVTYSSGWTYNAWTSASAGQIAVSATPNASASFTFTGRNVAWVGTKATNRGQAYIYLDGVYKATLDLYSATSVARGVLASYTWPTAGTHTIKVVVVGTSGRPSVDVDAFIRLT